MVSESISVPVAVGYMGNGPVGPCQKNSGPCLVVNKAPNEKTEGVGIGHYCC